MRIGPTIVVSILRVLYRMILRQILLKAVLATDNIWDDKGMELLDMLLGDGENAEDE